MPATKRLFLKSLTLSDITCQRGGRVLFQNFSLAVPAGTVLRLTGVNGAGKSSLLRMMAGALAMTAGKIFFGDENISEKDGVDHAQDYAFLPSEDRDLKLLETVRENMQFWSTLWKIEDEVAAVTAALAQMGLSALADLPVRVLSAGQKRRVSIARVLMKQSPLWLLDEPFNALDYAAAQSLVTAVQDHAAAGGIVVMAAHHVPEIDRMTTVKIGGDA